MIRSFLPLVALAVLSPAAVAQYPAYQYPASQSCASGQCPVAFTAADVVRPAVAPVTIPADVQVVRGVPADWGRPINPAPAFAPRRAAVTFVPGQPIRNAGRAVRQLFGR